MAVRSPVSSEPASVSSVAAVGEGVRSDMGGSHPPCGEADGCTSDDGRVRGKSEPTVRGGSESGTESETLCSPRRRRAGMSDATTAASAAYAARAVRGVVFSVFLLGAVAAVVGGRFVVAGGAFLAGYTVLAGAAVVHGQRRRGLGLSMTGVGWLLTAVGASVGLSTPTGTRAFAAGVGLLFVGTVALLRPLERLGIGASE